MSTPKDETLLVKRITDRLRKRGAWFFKVHGSAFQRPGIPDLVGCYRGRFFAIEAKTPDKLDTVTPLQAHEIKRIDAAGGCAGVVSTVEQAVALLDWIDKEWL